MRFQLLGMDRCDGAAQRGDDDEETTGDDGAITACHGIPPAHAERQVFSNQRPVIQTIDQKIPLPGGRGLNMGEGLGLDHEVGSREETRQEKRHRELVIAFTGHDHAPSRRGTIGGLSPQQIEAILEAVVMNANNSGSSSFWVKWRRWSGAGRGIMGWRQPACETVRLRIGRNVDAGVCPAAAVEVGE
jgi:hypothetical protein